MQCSGIKTFIHDKINPKSVAEGMQQLYAQRRSVGHATEVCWQVARTASGMASLCGPHAILKMSLGLDGECRRRQQGQDWPMGLGWAHAVLAEHDLVLSSE